MSGKTPRSPDILLPDICGLLTISGAQTEENLVNSAFCCFPKKKPTTCSPNPGLVSDFSATPQGQLHWTGPIANSSEEGVRVEGVSVRAQRLNNFKIALWD